MSNIDGIQLTRHDEFKNHRDGNVTSENGEHGIRYWDDKLSIETDNGWVDIETSSNGGNTENPTDPENPNQEIILNPDAVVYGIKIDETNSNPETALTYIDLSTGFTPARMNFDNNTFSYGSWEDKFPFNQIKPCVLKSDGTVNYYLNPNDYTKKADGSNANITTGADGNVMIEFPKIYWKFERIGTDLYIRYSDKQYTNKYVCLAHTKGSIEKEKVYISTYLGHYTSGQLKSLSGKTPTTNKTIDSFRSEATSNGQGFNQIGYYQILMLQVLFIIMFKDRNSQNSLGKGFTDESNTSVKTTGGTNTRGLFYGENTGKQQMKFCGIEDFWGNYYYWIDGICTNANGEILTSTDNFNSEGNGYNSHGKPPSIQTSGFIKNVLGDNHTGFIPNEKNASIITHYADFGIFAQNRVVLFGGWYGDGGYAGGFSLRFYSNNTTTYDMCSSRIMYL